MKKLLYGISWVVLLCACGSGISEPDGGWETDGAMYPPDFWDPGDKPNGASGYGDATSGPAVDCAQDPCVHGACLEGEHGDADQCVCDLGYAGTLCEACADGYVPDGLVCVPVDPCAPGPCVHGTCRVDGDDYLCECDEGYTGRNCDECAEGYHPEGLECVPD